MAEFSEDEPLEERLNKLLGRIDALSHEASAFASDRMGRIAERFSGKMEELGQDLKTRHDELQESANERKQRIVESVKESTSSARDRASEFTNRPKQARVVRDTAPPKVGQVDRAGKRIVDPVPSGLVVWEEPKVGILSKISTAVLNHMQYTLPAIILFSTIIWIGYFVEGTISHSFLEALTSVTGISDTAITLLFFWGAIPGRIISYPFHSGSSDDLIAVMDLVSLLLLIGAAGFFTRIRASRAVAASGFAISLIARIAIPLQSGAHLADFAIFESLTIILFTALFCFLLTLPKFKPKPNESSSDGFDIDPEILHSEPPAMGEPSKQTMEFLWFDSDMSDPTETLPRPKRPRGRSEYEMYEWVLLLVNLVLWPISILSTMVVGAGTDFMGMGPFNFDDNWLLLIGAWAPTAFFFYLLYRMDAAARDGQTYHMEKVAYQEAMTRYTEAKNAYLELLTLQAEVRKQEIIEENSNLDLSSAAPAAD